MNRMAISISLALFLSVATINTVSATYLRDFYMPDGGSLSVEGSGTQFDIWYRAIPQMCSAKDVYIGHGSFLNGITAEQFAQNIETCTFGPAGAICAATIFIAPEIAPEVCIERIGQCVVVKTGAQIFFQWSRPDPY